MAKYVDGFLLVVPKKNLSAYKRMASEAGKMWIKHGALQYVETVGDDLKPKVNGMRITYFPQVVATKPNEVIVFSFIEYKSRAHRDRVNAKVMKDPIMNDPKYKDKPMPFDMARMAYGGFTSLVNLSAKK